MYGNQIIWQNAQPSSPKFCRPIRMRFVKENKDITNEEIEYIENQAQKIHIHISISVVNENVRVKHFYSQQCWMGKCTTLQLKLLQHYVAIYVTKPPNSSTIYHLQKQKKLKHLSLGYRYCMHEFDFLSSACTCHIKYARKCTKAE